PRDAGPPEVESAVYETLAWVPWDTLTTRLPSAVVVDSRLRDLRTNDSVAVFHALDSANMARRVTGIPRLQVRNIELAPVGADTTVVTLELWPSMDSNSLGVGYSAARSNGWLARKLVYTLERTSSGWRLLRAEWGEP